MGNEFIQEKYKTALKYSCLEPDLLILENNDQTIIGEKGVNIRYIFPNKITAEAKRPE